MSYVEALFQRFRIGTLSQRIVRVILVTLINEWRSSHEEE